ncbi:homoserine O-succinyltransferase [Magnetovirga frankeli]|uniref:homoserine O-succinyltransferase MetA n=1 Tax=Magnetovirga frankeli TaxID=947516 RepID=UPI0012930145|nr:homoserine O-succinyltransferase [gamma proteobacterium SS-5]
MPIIAHNGLPSYARLREEGMIVLPKEKADQQYIRELHIGLLNMMPDAALAATERQFFRLVGESNPIAQFYLHPFSLDALPRSDKAQAHIDHYYERFADLRQQGLDALIITGANVAGPNLADQPFWRPLIEVIDWAAEHVTSTLCSCLATHAVLEFRYGQRRVPQQEKTWGVFPHQVLDRHHPLVNDVNTRFDVPHSRWNQVSRRQFETAGLHVLVESEQAGVHLATSEDGFRFVFFQGHPEYDTVSLLKEYKRELGLWQAGKRDKPGFPANYLGRREQAILNEFAGRLQQGDTKSLADFPEDLVAGQIDNTWHDTAEGLVGNWMGLVYQLTNRERQLPFMDGIDPANPLGLY